MHVNVPEVKIFRSVMYTSLNRYTYRLLKSKQAPYATLIYKQLNTIF
jgi:hypothetical protein